MKTRSSSGVGQKVDLEFNVETLRITDLDEPEDSNSLSQQKSNSNTSSLISGLKRNSVVSTITEDDANKPNKFDFSQLERNNKDKTRAPAIRSMLSSLNPEQD
jgi:hypothetical protein